MYTSFCSQDLHRQDRACLPSSQLSNPNWLQFSHVENVAAAQKCNKAREDLSRIPRAYQIDAFAIQPYRFLECHPQLGRSEPLKVNKFRAEAELRRLLTGSGFLCPTPNLPNPTWLKDSPRTGTMFICPINASKAFNTENQRHWKPQPPPVSRPERWCLWRESAARSDNTTVPMAHPEKGRAYGASKRTTQKSKLMERNIPNFGSILKVTVDKDVGSQVRRL